MSQKNATPGAAGSQRGSRVVPFFEVSAVLTRLIYLLTSSWLKCCRYWGRKNPHPEAVLQYHYRPLWSWGAYRSNRDLKVLVNRALVKVYSQEMSMSYDATFKLIFRRMNSFLRQ